jgi:hypothetical protein
MFEPISSRCIDRSNVNPQSLRDFGRRDPGIQINQRFGSLALTPIRTSGNNFLEHPAVFRAKIDDEFARHKISNVYDEILYIINQNISIIFGEIQ